MAYTAPTITDRIAAGDSKYTMQTLPDGRVLLTPSPDEVSVPGTEINKALLQPLVNAVADAWTRLLSMADIAMTGSYADLKNVPHYDVQTIKITSASWSGSTYARTMPPRYLLWSPAAHSLSYASGCGLSLLVDQGKAYGLYVNYQGTNYSAVLRSACGDTSLSLGQGSYQVCDLSFASTRMTVTKQDVSSLDFAYLQL